MGMFEDEFGGPSGPYERARAPKTDTAGGPPCPTCGLSASRVIETRRHGSVIRRRRQCIMRECERFTSYESTVDPSVVEFKLSKLDKRVLSSVMVLLNRIAKKIGLE